MFVVQENEPRYDHWQEVVHNTKEDHSGEDLSPHRMRQESQ